VIPILAVPSLNRPDLLRAMVASIDHPVGRMIVIDNSQTGEMWDAIADVIPTCVADTVVLEAPWNMGLAGAWNLAIKAAPRAAFWFLPNNDVAFGPGDLGRLADAMADPAPHVAMLYEYAAFALNRAVVDAVGWFDENFYPIYCEDSDYRWRCRITGIPEVEVPGSTTHAESQSWQADGTVRLANRLSYGRNRAYYLDKWGGDPRAEVYRSPFDRGGWVGEWHVDLATLGAFRWDDPPVLGINWPSPRTWRTTTLPPVGETR
jgi:GT2 family glycosyltransferase